MNRIIMFIWTELRNIRRDTNSLFILSCLCQITFIFSLRLALLQRQEACLYLLRFDARDLRINLLLDS